MSTSKTFSYTMQLKGSGMARELYVKVNIYLNADNGNYITVQPQETNNCKCLMIMIGMRTMATTTTTAFFKWLPRKIYTWTKRICIRWNCMMKSENICQWMHTPLAILPHRAIHRKLKRMKITFLSPTAYCLPRRYIRDWLFKLGIHRSIHTYTQKISIPV